MFSKVIFLVLLASSGALAWDSSEEFDSHCDSSCPDDEAARSCCQEMGFATGYCKPYGRAECEGRRSYGRIQNGGGYGRQIPSSSNARGVNTGGRIPTRNTEEGYGTQLPGDNNVRGASGILNRNEEFYTDADRHGHSAPQNTGVKQPTSSRGRRSLTRFWSCDPTCETGGSVAGCCRNHGFGSGNCDEGNAYCVL